MQPTKLVYLEDFNMLTLEAEVLEMGQEEETSYVILDQTVFYAQGGGQPADKGLIIGTGGVFKVDNVRFADGIVKHYGVLESGVVKPGEKIQCSVDEERRALNSRLHSGGHMIDKAVVELGLDWIPGKGYHFPAGPYIEYSGSFEGVDKEKLKADIEALCKKYIAEDGATKLIFMDKEKMKEICHYVPDYLPEGKPTRVVVLGDFAVPCGGTHVGRLSELVEVTVRKIKQDGANIVRVGYDVSK